MIIKCISCGNEFENMNKLNKKFNNCPYCGKQIIDEKNIELLLKMKFYPDIDDSVMTPIMFNSYDEEEKKSLNTVSIYKITQEFKDPFGNINKNARIEMYYSDEDSKGYNDFYINENYDYDFELKVNSYGLQNLECAANNKNINMNEDILYSNLLSIFIVIKNQKQNDYFSNYFTFDIRILNELITNLRNHDKVLKFDLNQIYLYKSLLNKFVDSIEKDFPPEYLVSLGE